MKNGLVIDKDGSKLWYLNDKLHCTDGPAIEWSHGTKEWWMNGKRHRTDGPAVEYTNGTTWWWMNDVFLNENDKGFWSLWDLLTDEQRSNLDLLMWLPRI